MAILKENVAAGLSQGSKFKAGISDYDPGKVIEQGVKLPWPSQPNISWVYYDCTVSAMLDSGIVVHNRLPQIDNTYDTLGMCDFNDPNLDTLINGGVNIHSNDEYTDIVQRMAHSRYWFRIHGQALRIGKKIPIPSLKTVGGVSLIPHDNNPQWAFNRIAPGVNYNGVILWHAAWSLWYTTLTPPRTQFIPAADPSAHISEATPQPPTSGIQAPYSQPDDNATKVAPSVSSNTNANVSSSSDQQFFNARVR